LSSYFWGRKRGNHFDFGFGIADLGLMQSKMEIQSELEFPNPNSAIRNDILTGWSTNLDKGAQIYAVPKTASLETFGL